MDGRRDTHSPGKGSDLFFTTFGHSLFYPFLTIPAYMICSAAVINIDFSHSKGSGQNRACLPETPTTSDAGNALLSHLILEP